MTLEQAATLTDAQVEGLLGAYLERKRLEAKITLSVLGDALGPKKPDMSLGALAAMGFRIEGA